MSAAPTNLVVEPSTEEMKLLDGLRYQSAVVKCAAAGAAAASSTNAPRIGAALFAPHFSGDVIHPNFQMRVSMVGVHVRLQPRR